MRKTVEAKCVSPVCENHAEVCIECANTYELTRRPDGLLAMKRDSVDVLDLLKNLLAVIHRDGGHYTDEHGLEKSARDAESRVAGWLRLGDGDER